MPNSARLLAITILTFLFVVPAAQAACEDQVLEQPFAAYGDHAYYTLVSDGTVELSAGESFTTPPVCVSLAHPTMRFFQRGGLVRVEVVAGGLTLPVGLSLGGATWGPSPPLLVVGNLIDDEVSFRFTSLLGSAAIGDVWVDPYKKG